MGGHGGLNILPQKRWNVYRFDNMEKVRKDEEAAAKEEQIKREQSRKRDAEFRLAKLRQSRGIADPSTTSSSSAAPSTPVSAEPTPGHINLFEGLRVFPAFGGEVKDGQGQDKGSMRKKLKKEEAPPPKVVISAEDEKYRLGYGIAGKGVKAPWYLSTPSLNEDDENRESSSSKQEEKKKSGKKTLDELREERLEREKREKEREMALLKGKNKRRYH